MIGNALAAATVLVAGVGAVAFCLVCFDVANGHNPCLLEITMFCVIIFYCT